MRQHHFTYRPDPDPHHQLVHVDGRCWTNGHQFHVALRNGRFQATFDYVCDEEEELYTAGWLVSRVDVDLEVGTHSSHDKAECVNAFLATLPTEAAKQVRPELMSWLV